MRVLVTGAGGFVGNYVCRRLRQDQHEVWAAVRRAGSAPVETREFVVGDLGDDVNWSAALDGVEAVIHLAARVHVMKEVSGDPLTEFRRINVAGSLNLAKSAQRHGVGRFVYMSSIKVNGERTASEPFDASSMPAPSGPYGLSKWEAEEGLAELSSEGEMKVISVRCPMVYGPGVGGNMARLMRWAGKGYPVPLGAVHNKRTLISVHNLADVLAACACEEGLTSGLVLAGDEHSPSTSELFRQLASAMGRPAHLLSVPASWISAVGKLAGRRDEVARLMESLEVRTSTTVEGFSWSPVTSFQDAIRELGDSTKAGPKP